MEKITLNFSSEEKELLDHCVAVTKLKPTPLLRALIANAFDELLWDISENQQFSLPVTEQRNKENDYRLPVPIDRETNEKYEKIKSYMPVYAGDFTKMLIMPKLKNIRDKKQTLEEMIL